MLHPFFVACLALVIAHTSLSTAAAQAAPDALAPARQHFLHQEYGAASASYQRGLKQTPGKPRDYYQAAQAAARNHEPKRALDWLTQAVAKGYFSEEQLRTEEDFASLASQPAWPRLLTQARTKQQQHEAAFDPALVALLKKIQYQDQQYRLEAKAAERKYGINAPQIDQAMQQQGRVDIRLAQQVDSLIARHGYPGRSLVGEYQKGAAFFVIQHNPDEKYLPLLTAAADKKELAWSSVAIFIDRIKKGRGEPQVYGSQFNGQADGHYLLQPIEDEPQVDVRRAKVGLPPLAEYLQQWGIAYQVPTATHNPNPPTLYAPSAAAPVAAAREASAVELIGSYEALKAQVRYPAAAQAQQVRGKVTLQLRIDPAGVPQDVVVVKGLGYGCDEEAVRVMRAARYQNPAGQEHEIRVSLPFPYVPAPVEQ
ncbi:energy transducer TonB [Hymenobacter properus]|uniref:Energy transducer TonB n=1 Tax=Hymenobacter properus TaxID=2791026 RepID=A0A931FKS4_9BACT|nr:energy transducer TonB [Hymenobacter properus]MBF9144237.1 energy transducer TonB [Hymenobacter properus]MBR7723055.1 energy transducer TonB [Microvirga sp. SRT04]